MPENLKPLPDNTFARLNDRGLIEVIDKKTGQILCVQTSYRDLLQAKSDRITRIDTPEGPVFIERGINFDIVSHLKTMPYSKLLGDLLCQTVAEGKSLIKACEKFNLQYADVKRWEREHEDFKTALFVARKDRAEYLHDKIMEKAEEGTTGQQIDALKYLAEKGDPDKFGPKKQAEALGGGITQVFINTGINRDPVAVAKDVTPVIAEVQADNKD